MNPLPPAVPPSPSRGLAAGRWLATATALVLAFTGGACEAHPDESLAGLAIASNGTIDVTDDEGRLKPVDGPPGDVRFVTASDGRIAARTVDGEILVSDAVEGDAARSWRQVPVGGSSGRTSSGMDLSLDGRALAIVLGDPETPGLELVAVDMVTGKATVHSIDLMSNGPPSWLDADRLVLEVIRPDQHSGIATANPATGDVTLTDAQGFALSVTRDGSRVAVVDDTSGLVTIRDPDDWLAGVPGDAPGITSPADSSIQDVQIDADGTRLAVVYAANSGASWTVTILRLVGTVWEAASSIPVPGDTLVSVDWLD